MSSAPKSRKAPLPQATEPSSPAELYAAPLTGQVLAVVFGLLFLFQCMILPLVGKAAMGGSGSPGATTAEWAGQNARFFLVMLLLTLLTGGAALGSKLLRRRRDGGPFPTMTAALLGLTVALLLAFAAGLLKL
ncbi:MAG: hypothetical protein GX803_09690 [Lentisphaerae bacterium]|jgi:hypothetical protein|nr:hypothetical protein [Lentisphaerota bacterium]